MSRAAPCSASPTRTNANYVTFNVAGTADPLPGIGQGLTPVITVTDPESGDVDECIPEIGFDDAESWVAFLGIDALDEEELEGVLEVVPYPGTPGYLVPNSGDVVEPRGSTRRTSTRSPLDRLAHRIR